jgi:hypothetical protein
MPRPIYIILAVLLALGAIEGIAYWWMNPAPAGLGEPVLVYRPSRSVGVAPTSEMPKATDKELSVARGRLSEEEMSEQDEPAPTDPSLPPSTCDVGSSTFDVPSSFTLLPDLVSRSMPSLRCSAGIAARIDRPNGATVHLAFFEWNLADSTNVLEAFKHLPDECMGSIGMTLVKKRPPRTYLVRNQETGNRARGSAGVPPASQGSADDTAQSSSTNLQSPISNLSSSTLSFDHTEFRDPSGKTIHAFKGVWVSGASGLLGDGIRGGGEQWNQIRWRAALKRFRPAYARVAQGAVRGIPNPDLAWEIFEQSMLQDLTFER